MARNACRRSAVIQIDSLEVKCAKVTRLTLAVVLWGSQRACGIRLLSRHAWEVVVERARGHPVL